MPAANRLKPVKDLKRVNAKLPMKLWLELNKALKNRAVRMTSENGVLVSAGFSAWLRDKARETIEAYK